MDQHFSRHQLLIAFAAALGAMTGCHGSELCTDSGVCADLDNPIAYPGPCSAVGDGAVDHSTVETEYYPLVDWSCSYEYLGDALVELRYSSIDDQGEEVERLVEYQRASGGDLERIDWTITDELGTSSGSWQFDESGSVREGSGPMWFGDTRRYAREMIWWGHPIDCIDLKEVWAEEGLVEATSGEETTGYTYDQPFGAAERWRYPDDDDPTDVFVFLHDGDGKLTETRRPGTGHDIQIVRYDSAGRQTRRELYVPDRDLTITQREWYYDEGGNLAAATDTDGVPTVYAYDCWN